MRIIDADALQRVLLPITFALEREYGSLGGAVSGVMKHIDSAPTIDAVPVVRCRDCKHRDGTPGQPNIDCWQMHDDDFCSYGERKEGADDE